MNDKHLVNSLPYVLGVVAAGTGVSIKTDQHASTASTNGKVIYFPPLPYKGEELAVYSLGYLIHEAGHIRATDFTCIGDVLQNPLGKMLVNVLEDVRIERIINGVYPGARIWLDGLTLKFVETKRQGVVDPDAELVLIMIRYLQDWLFESVLGYASVKGIGTQQRDVWRSKVSAELADQVEKIALASAWASSTSTVVAGATEIIALLQKEQQSSEQQAQQPQQAQPDGDVQEDQSNSDCGDGSSAQAGQAPEDSDSDSSDGDDASADPGDDAKADTGDDTGSQSDQGGNDQSADARGTGNQSGGQDDKDSSNPSKPSLSSSNGADGDGAEAGGSSPDSDKTSNDGASPQETDPQAYADALQSLLGTDEVEQGADRGDAIKQDMQSSVGTSRSHRDSTFSLPEVMPPLKKGGDADALGRVKAASIALRYRMGEFLEANMKSRRRPADSGKRLIRDASRRLALGDFRIFEKRFEGQKIDTAVHVLLDISSSMLIDSRYKVALDSSLALGVALQEIDGIIFSMSAFPFHQHHVADVVLPGELVRDVASRAAVMVPNGSTPLDMGLLHAHTALMTTKASRRVCLVVTDGEPDDVEAAKLLISMGQNDGIEYLGIGIACPTYHILPNSCVVSNLEDLPRQVIAMMQNVILLPKAA